MSETKSNIILISILHKLSGPSFWSMDVFNQHHFVNNFSSLVKRTARLKFSLRRRGGLMVSAQGPVAYTPVTLQEVT